jgi:hypothetical protein
MAHPTQGARRVGVHRQNALELAALVAARRYGDAVKHFHTNIGLPGEFMAEMQSTPEWAKMASIAHTLVYDSVMSESTTPIQLRSGRQRSRASLDRSIIDFYDADSNPSLDFMTDAWHAHQHERERARVRMPGQ